MKKATPRPSKRGRTSIASSSRPPVPSPDETPSSSPPHPSNALKPNTKILESVQDRPIVVERRVLVDQIKNFDLREVVGREAWEGILSWGNDAFPSIVRNMYASISNIEVTVNSCSFTISFVDRDEVITLERIGSIIGVPISPNGFTVIPYSLTEEERGKATHDLCGFHSILDPRKHHLTLFSLFPIYQIIHNIFTYNVYSRSGKRTELTAYMVSILSKVVTRTSICLPSLICHIIIRFHSSMVQKNAIPFGYLMTALAFSFGVPKPHGERPLFKGPFSQINLNQMNLLPNNHVPIADDPPIAQEPASPSPPPPRASSSRHSSSPRPSTSSSTLDRLGAIVIDVACIKMEHKKMKKTMNKMFQYLSTISKSCRRDDVAAPPSPCPPPPDSD
ncbi:hypothetical protein MRB53_021279 [Persea americana]|uniref:Uncharacterized protein n=1 Tax=Persea americana TaxID=3435 RepID=A0ACC2L3A6_PERAE|nr:hypothetical protein MRB53_021279 [Persea americana]